MAETYWFETDEHRTLRAQVRRFASEHVAPHAHTWDEAEEFPRALYQTAARAGVLGIGYAEVMGGAGGDITHVLVASEEMILAGKNVGVVAGLGSHAIALPPILIAGSDEQRTKFVPPVLCGEKIAALAVTEPGAGSDVASITTRAIRDGDRFVVSGEKMFITSGVRADFVVAAVRTGDAGHGGISLLVIPRDAPGYSISKAIKKTGWRSSDTAAISFDGCRVPIVNRIGQENQGFYAIMTNFVSERLHLGAQCVAIAELAYRESIDYARMREAFGKTLTAFQVTRHKLADMATQIAAARALVGELAMRHLRGDDVAGLAAKTKNACSDMCSAVVDHAVQIHGGAGYMRETVVERLYRDARLYPIGGGTREIMNEVIAKTERY